MLPPDDDSGTGRCRFCLSILRPLQTVRGVITALQAACLVHLGVNRLNVVNHVARIISGRKPDKPNELFVDGNVLKLVQELIRASGLGNTVISLRSEVMLMRAWPWMAESVSWRGLEMVANLGMRRVDDRVMDAGRALLRACRTSCRLLWTCIVSLSPWPGLV